MTEIMPFPENNCETVLLDRPERVVFFCFSIQIGIRTDEIHPAGGNLYFTPSGQKCRLSPSSEQVSEQYRQGTISGGSSRFRMYCKTSVVR